jgi:pyruvate kinase
MFEKSDSVCDVMAASCVLAATKINAGGIVVLGDKTGDVTRLISKYRPNMPVLVILDSSKVARQLNIHRSVYSTLLPQSKALSAAVEQGLFENKDTIVVVNVSVKNVFPFCFFALFFSFCIIHFLSLSPPYLLLFFLYLYNAFLHLF